MALGTQMAGGTTVTGVRLHVGRGSYIGPDCLLDIHRSASVSIGDRTSIGPRVTILTSSHALGSSPKRAGTSTAEDVVVGDGVWIGAGAMLLPGIKVHDGAVVAAGSVVTADVPANALVAGVPATVKRELDAKADCRDLESGC